MSQVSSVPFEGLFSWINKHVDHSPQALSQWTLRQRYARGGERDLIDVQRRVARELSGAEAEGVQRRWRNRFLSAQMRGFLPAGRILAGCGQRPAQTLMSCFVQPMPASQPFVDGLSSGVESALTEALITLGMGGGVGFDFSPVMPRLQGQAWGQSGPDGVVDTVRYLDDTCRHLADGRRVSQLAVLRCDHPDIEEFVEAKRAGGLGSIGLAVGVTDAFMHAVLLGDGLPLVHPSSFISPGEHGAAARRGGGWGEVDARRLWRSMMQAAVAVGEPGLVFLDKLDADNNLSDGEALCTTSPCGEQALPAYGACCLGSIDLSRCVRHPFTSSAEWDWALLSELVPIAVRMLDNVLDVTAWPLPQQRDEALSKRRIGLGITGLADALAMKGLRYASEAARVDAAAIVACIRNLAFDASCELAIEKGAFPALDRELYLRAPHAASRLPDWIQEKIRRTGLRNAHVLAIAPARSISLACADNVSAGIEAPLGFSSTQHVRDADGHTHTFAVTNHALRAVQAAWGVNQREHVALMASASELTPEDQLAMLLALTPLVDGGISKALILPDGCDPERLAQLCWKAWEGDVKVLPRFNVPAPFTTSSRLC
jgi:ribonucleoside-diphosphate reductase alpha chain